MRLLEGERAHRPLPAPGRRYPAGIPDRPKGMTAPARRVWDAYVDQMAALGTLRPIDAFALQRLCEDVALLQELQAGMREMAADRDRAERDRRKKLRALQAEVKRLTAAGTQDEQIGRVKAEAAELDAQKPEAPALIVLTMSHEGRRLSATINALASRICRQELQFGLTPVSSQRLENGGFGGGMMPSAMEPDQSIESALCG